MNGGSNDAPGNLIRLHQPSSGIDGGACNDAPSNWRPTNMSMATWISGEPQRIPDFWLWLANGKINKITNSVKTLVQIALPRSWMVGFSSVQYPMHQLGKGENMRHLWTTPSQHKSSISHANIKTPTCLLFKCYISLLWSLLPFIFTPWTGAKCLFLIAGDANQDLPMVVASGHRPSIHKIGDFRLHNVRLLEGTLW